MDTSFIHGNLSPYHYPQSLDPSMSPLTLPSSEHLVDTLTSLCEKAHKAPVWTTYMTEYGLLTLFAITEESGPLSVVLNGCKEIMTYEHSGSGATVLGWSPDVRNFDELKDVYSWAAEKMEWLPAEPVEGTKGATKKLIKI